MDHPPVPLPGYLAPNPGRDPPPPRHSCSLTKPGTIWAGSAPGCQSGRRGRPCSESSSPGKKYRVDCSRELFPFPRFFFGKGGHLAALGSPSGRQSHISPWLLGGRAGVKIGERGRGAGRPPAARQESWPTGSGEVGLSRAWGGF